MTIETEQQQLVLGAVITLYQLDLSSKGGVILYWTSSKPTADKPITFGGNNYVSVDVQFEGLEKTSTGTLPRPRISVSNADNLVGALLTQFDDMRGCKLIRIRTLYKFLDDQPGADPTAHWPVDIFYVDRKVVSNKNIVTMELASSLEQRSVKIPGNLVLRNTCILRYREYDTETGDFDYTNATCPYTGEDCFTKLDATTASKVLDSCGKRVNSCKLRFGENAELPFGAYPGLGRA